MAEIERPLRSEAQDVQIAVTDGVDGLILNEEAANGRYAVESLNAISRCSAEAERCIDYKSVI